MVLRPGVVRAAENCETFVDSRYNLTRRKQEIQKNPEISLKKSCPIAEGTRDSSTRKLIP